VLEAGLREKGAVLQGLNVHDMYLHTQSVHNKLSIQISIGVNLSAKL